MKNHTVWREKLGLKECPYMVRWVLDLFLFAFRLHHWLASDDKRAPHDHHWWFITIVLKGFYIDLGEKGIDIMYPGRIMFRRSTYKHTVLVPDSCWTLMLSGKKSRNAGFWVDGKYVKSNKYFYSYGHHPCIDGEKPVRSIPK